jgi:hypothetical protein
MNLRIKLRGGFRNDRVSMQIDGQEVYRKQGINADLSISFADGIEVEVRQSVVTLTIAVEGRGWIDREIHPQETPFVDVYFLEDTLKLRLSKEQILLL